ncbi:SRPBCC domain-containing protein [Micromonospora taraxaci]|uniref:Carbon monoxide dehydrogenase subunit G n=1 Tax=Micromonospora taraxaci TaxID=1316803 RepID=A0A561W170_9ACTN|nr:SRPBCC domain-containing protein [Micromonospora taraxaci]TWG17613.1 carbon monoxide dehydrogenase subunit G [Micromonospora taraxaci]
MKISNEFAVAVPIEQAWSVLTDLEGLAPCLPGAQLTGVDGDVYRGRVRVKVGPVISEFAGTAQFVEKDDAAYRGVIDAKGRDARSTGNASALVTAQLRPDGDRTLVSVDTDLKISGKLAQFGSAMIKEVSGKLLAQFVANLEAKLAAEQPTAAAPTPRTDPEPVAPKVAAPSDPAASATAIVTTPSTAAVAPSPVEPSPLSSSAAAPSPVTPSVVGPSADTARATPAAEPEALDLLSIAGGSVTKRLVPALVGLVAVGAVIVWLVARR